MQQFIHVCDSKNKNKKVNEQKEDNSVDVLISKYKCNVKEIASTSNKLKSSEKDDAQSNSTKQEDGEENWGKLICITLWSFDGFVCIHSNKFLRFTAIFKSTVVFIFI